MRVRRLTGLLVLALLTGAGLSGAARGGYAGADGAISYTPYGGSGEGIYAIEGGKRSRLVKADPGSGVSDGVWSPDGHELAFLKDTFADHEGGQDMIQLQVLDVETGQTRTVLTAWGSLAKPTWSPDGTKLAYRCDGGICVIDLTGNHLWTAPTVSPLISDVQWSPDGDLGYVATSGQTTRVWVEGAHGENMRPVTPDEKLTWNYAWSPDGRSIAYIDSTDHLIVGSATGAQWQTISSGALNSVVWSPDGTKLLFNGWFDPNNKPAGSGLITIAVDGSDRRQILDPATNAPINSYDPDWQRVAVRPSSTAAPTVSGTAAVGSSLTATSGTWRGDAPLAFSYAWQRCDSNGDNCASIGGATATTYTIKTADAGARLRATVTAKNSAGTAVASSAPTALVIIPNERPRITRATAAVHARRVHLTTTFCDDTAGKLRMYATDWKVVKKHATAVQHRSWVVIGVAGCRTAAASWRVVRRAGAVYTIALRVRDAQGAWSTPKRVSLRFN